MKLWEPKRKCPKDVSTHLQIMYCGHGFSSVVWSHMWSGPQPNAISINFYSCGSSHIIKWNKLPVVSVQSAIVFQLCVRPISKSWFLKIVQVTINMIRLMPCKDPCRLYIHLAFTYSVDLSSVVWRELRLAPPFPPMRVLEVSCSQALGLVCVVAFGFGCRLVVFCLQMKWFRIW